MIYRNYTIEKSINFAGYEFIHNDYCGASDSGFTVGLANSEQDAKEQIDEMECEQSGEYCLYHSWPKGA